MKPALLWCRGTVVVVEAVVECVGWALNVAVGLGRGAAFKVCGELFGSGSDENCSMLRRT